LWGVHVWQTSAVDLSVSSKREVPRLLSATPHLARDDNAWEGSGLSLASFPGVVCCLADGMG
jgi:hypothetical protein